MDKKLKKIENLLGLMEENLIFEMNFPKKFNENITQKDFEKAKNYIAKSWMNFSDNFHVIKAFIDNQTSKGAMKKSDGNGWNKSMGIISKELGDLFHFLNKTSSIAQ